MLEKKNSKQKLQHFFHKLKRWISSFIQYVLLFCHSEYIKVTQRDVAASKTLTYYHCMTTHGYCMNQPYVKHVLIINSIILLGFWGSVILSPGHILFTAIHQSTDPHLLSSPLLLYLWPIHWLITHLSILFRIDSSIYTAHLYVSKLGQQTSMLLKTCWKNTTLMQRIKMSLRIHKILVKLKMERRKIYKLQ